MLPHNAILLPIFEIKLLAMRLQIDYLSHVGCENTPGKGKPMSKKISKKKDGDTIFDFTVDAWPTGNGQEFINSAVKLWGPVAVARFVSGAPQIEARAVAVGHLTGNMSTKAVSVGTMQGKMKSWKPSTSATKRGLSNVEKVQRLIKTTGMTGKEIQELLDNVGRS